MENLPRHIAAVPRSCAALLVSFALTVLLLACSSCAQPEPAAGFRRRTPRRRYGYGAGGYRPGNGYGGGYGSYYPPRYPPRGYYPRKNGTTVPPGGGGGPPIVGGSGPATIITVAGNGTKGASPSGTLATEAMLNNPNGVAVDARGNVYIADPPTHTVKFISVDDGRLYILAGTAGRSGWAGDNGLATSAFLNNPRGVGVNVENGVTVVYIADSGNNRIRRVPLVTRIITTFAGPLTSGPAPSGTNQAQVGDGGLATASAARLANPRFFAFDSRSVYWSDVDAFRVRRVDLTTNIITTVAGTGVQGLAVVGRPVAGQPIGSVRGVAVDPRDEQLVFSDTLNHRVLKIGATGDLVLVAGTGIAGYDASITQATSTRLSTPSGLVFDPAGTLYIADIGNNIIRDVNATSGEISTFAGVQTSFGYNGDNILATTAWLYNAQALAVGPSIRDVTRSAVYLADSTNTRVRMVNGLAR